MGPKARTVKFYSTVSDRSEIIHLIARLFNSDGGPGSGNHGHAGRPGERGGSAPSGSGENGETKAESVSSLKEQMKGLSRFGEQGRKRNELQKRISELEGKNNSQEKENKPKSVSQKPKQDTLYEKLSAAREKRNRLQKEWDEKWEVEAKEWVSKLTDAMDNGTIKSVMAKYKKWEVGYAQAQVDLHFASQEVEEAKREYNDQYDKDAKEKEDEEIRKSGLSEADWRRKKAVQEYGYTTDFREAGYMLPNGKLLNFCGDKGQHLGTRGKDHRDIAGLYAVHSSSGSDALVKFMTDGNIRVYAEAPGFDISTASEPTEEQYKQIEAMAQKFARTKGFYIEFTGEDGHTEGHMDYEAGAKPEKIVSDIRRFYQTGKVPEKSTVSQFHTSDKKAVDGGPGSGNHGHAGRPGKVGGSAPEGANGETSETTSPNIQSAIKSMTQNIDKARERTASERDMWKQFSFFADYMNGITYGSGAGHDAVYAYNYHGDVLMNNLLRKGKPYNYSQQEDWLKSEQETRKHVEALTDVISKNRLRKPAVVYRGVSTKLGLSKMLGLGVSGDEMDKMLQDPDFAKSLIGHTYSDPAFTSTSIDPEVPRKTGFAKAAEIEIYCPEGTQGVYIGDQARITDEHEYLMQRGTQFVVTEAEVFENQFGVKRLRLKVAVVDQVPKEIPSAYERAYGEPKKEIMESIGGEGFDDKKLQTMFPDVPAEYISEINKFRKADPKKDIKAWERLHDILELQTYMGNISPMEAAELYTYAMNTDKMKDTDNFVTYKSQLEKEVEEAIKAGGSLLRQEVKEMYPDADESVVPLLMHNLHESRETKERAESDLKQYGDSIIVQKLLSRSKALIDEMEEISRQKMKKG